MNYYRTERTISHTCIPPYLPYHTIPLPPPSLAHLVLDRRNLPLDYYLRATVPYPPKGTDTFLYSVSGVLSSRQNRGLGGGPLWKNHFGSRQFFVFPCLAGRQIPTPTDSLGALALPFLRPAFPAFPCRPESPTLLSVPCPHPAEPMGGWNLWTTTTWRTPSTTPALALAMHCVLEPSATVSCSSH